MAPTYRITALQITVYFNREGDHDHNGLIYCLDENLPLLKYVRAVAMGSGDDDPEQYRVAAEARLEALGIPVHEWPAYLPPDKTRAQQPHPLVRPLVLRANVGSTLTVQLTNEIQGRWVGVHLVADGYDVTEDDGSHVGANPHSLVPPGATRSYTWECRSEGVFPFHDGGNYSGGEDGTNVHGLFGALVVEAAGAVWRDPVTGVTSAETTLDGLYLDVLPPGCPSVNTGESAPSIAGYQFPPPLPYPDFAQQSYREFVIFFHDEPEFLPPHHKRTPDPCHAAGGGGSHDGHGGHGDLPPIMPVSYRAEPMVNREHVLWDLLAKGHELDRPVLNEEQHHSSWLFGDPVTPILMAYIGDPVRIRFVHAGVKETHVFHLHLYEWHAVPQDRLSPRIDAISVSPQTGHTIEPVWGAGNRQQVAGDAIWHCHLYPHFHEGMWGMFRTFETRQDGVDGPPLASTDPVYEGRRIGRYPDGTRIEKLLPLPDREPPPLPTPTHPGYPLYIAGKVKQKSPIPPFPGDAMPADFDYRPTPTDLEWNAFNPVPVPGEMFTRNPFEYAQARQWAGEPYDPDDPSTAQDFGPNDYMVVDHRIAVDMTRIEYNGHGWHDKHGHLFYLVDDCHPQDRPWPEEPLFFRAQHGQILNLPLQNHLPLEIPGTEFDPPFPPCPARPWEAECGLHVHMVKFDPICADGASVGWNYISAPVAGKKMVYRWWLDREFGTIFFHDHLFANYRQKHGLFGALIVEPVGARFLDPWGDGDIVSGAQARILLPGSTDAFREFCVGIGDFIPMWNGDGEPLNPPDHPGGHGDQGVMGLNYRSDPIHERLRPYPGEPRREADPADWFTSGPPYDRDPYTTLFATFQGDPLRFRLVQGSHEEQHSFQVHGMRWPRFRDNVKSPLQNQQTIGISEAFTFTNREPYGPGDYMYKLSGADDLWLGCWGIIRAYPPGASPDETGGLVPLPAGQAPVRADNGPVREFRVKAVHRTLVYRDPDLVDPFGLIYQLQSITGPDGVQVPVILPTDPRNPEPLVLRCIEGERVRIILENDLPEELRPEPFAPEVPVEQRNPFSHRPERRVSSRVSMHADLVLYDVKTSDGATVGRNPVQTVDRKGEITYQWRTARPAGTNAGKPIGPVLLQDMADFRNHRHHGLIGALIVEPQGGAIPLEVKAGEATAAQGVRAAWNGPRATLRGGGKDVEEAVLLLQDGLRLFLRGNIHAPIPDEPPGPGEHQPDHEDQGQKAFNYRSEPVGPNADPSYDPDGTLPPGHEGRDWLSKADPATPVFLVPEGSRVRLHLLGACDKPRNHSFTVHGVTWQEWPHVNPVPRVASESALSAGSTRTYGFTMEHAGDHAYRSGVLKWAVPQGLWGLLRVE
jgi:hypothetical protein